MSQDIFDFWSQIPEDAFVHPADKPVFERAVKHDFATNCFPQAYRGQLRKAPVVLLFLSPGLDKSDAAHCATNGGREYYARQRSGNEDLPNEKDHSSAYRWLNKLLPQFGITFEQARSTVATLNIGAYKSEKFNDSHMLSALPSSRVTLDWAQSVLFPEAQARKRIVVCLRSHKYWGLGKKSEGWLFCPPVTIGAIMKRTDERNEIAALVRSAVLGGTVPAKQE